MAGKLEQYLDRYEREHQHPLNQLTHTIGIPAILASLPLFFTQWKVALALFAGGWLFQLIGHKIEGNKPAFLSNLVYLVVGPVFIALKILGKRPSI